MMTIEPVKKLTATFPDQARKLFLLGWWRVVRSDGSTAAYVPDETTAHIISRYLEDHTEEQLRKALKVDADDASLEELEAAEGILDKLKGDA